MGTSRLPAEARQRRRSELREFLRSRRARLTPADVGMPDSGNRRTPGLRREEVAVLAGVGVSWYTWLEQGRDINVSADVLDAVARVLRLGPAEREHLYLLAGLNPPPPAPSRQHVPDELRRLIDGWLPRPAYVMDRHWNTVVLNRAARLAFQCTEHDHNCLVSFFTNARYRAVLKHWRNAAREVVGQFRADAARYPEDPEFGRLASDLCAVSPDFAGIWAELPVGGSTHGTKALELPGLGTLTFEYTALPLPELPGHRLLLHTPAPGTGTEARLAELLAAPEPSALRTPEGPKVVVPDPGSADTAGPAPAARRSSA
ncbi:helix-turn-helix transcriptional regulator [Streptomyces sp. TRM 70361]|uniref:helix-turn-helix transcriptional regulator n=1 Tax=Streptomyces sp. TRM 70361 TaxID=3116553 RepID=UPI002E7AEA30|nr:helix-turn-helix transcriptional regulator [Streptomyces sp. TRM 70361]MEE1938685.1 helix-turn-helix transcriptional regulator [Streptomyces sp. TRM 70361]